MLNSQSEGSPCLVGVPLLNLDNAKKIFQAAVGRKFVRRLANEATRAFQVILLDLVLNIEEGLAVDPNLLLCAGVQR
jgi:hypothetical protein